MSSIVVKITTGFQPVSRPGPEWPSASAGLPGLPMLAMMEVAPRPARAGLAGVHSWRLRGLPARFNRPARPVAPGLPARLVIFGGLIACGICPERRPVAGVASGSSFRSKPVWRSPVPRNRPCRELSAPIVRPGPEGCHVQAGGLPVKCFWKIAHYRRFDFGGVSSCHTARNRLPLLGVCKPSSPFYVRSEIVLPGLEAWGIVKKRRARNGRKPLAWFSSFISFNGAAPVSRCSQNGGKAKAQKRLQLVEW